MEVEYVFRAVDFVHVRPELCEAEALGESARGDVAWCDGNNELRDLVTLIRRFHESLAGLSGVALPPEWGEDLETELDGIGRERVQAWITWFGLAVDVAGHPMPIPQRDRAETLRAVFGICPERLQAVTEEVLILVPFRRNTKPENALNGFRVVHER